MYGIVTHLYLKYSTAIVRTSRRLELPEFGSSDVRCISPEVKFVNVTTELKRLSATELSYKAAALRFADVTVLRVCWTYFDVDLVQCPVMVVADIVEAYRCYDHLY